MSTLTPEDWQALGALVGLLIFVLTAAWLAINHDPFDDGDF